MAFQRSYSKVWWGNFSQNALYNNDNSYNDVPTLNYFSKAIKNLPQIQENINEDTKLFNNSYDSPGSLRSEDSGFSDNDDANKIRNSTSPLINDSKICDKSPSPTSEIGTPPTVIKRENIASPLLAARQISFNDLNSPISTINHNTNILNQFLDVNSSECNYINTKDKCNRRKRIINRKTRRALVESDGKNNLHQGNETNFLYEPFKDYHNETVYLGYPDQNTVSVSTSTPNNNKSLQTNLDDISFDRIPQEITSNDHYLPSVQCWLDELRFSYNHEVMSMLQTKSIAQEAFRNLKITTPTVAKIIRQLQTRSIVLQGEFERIENILQNISSHSTAISTTQDFLDSIKDFTKLLERRSVFLNECRNDYKKFIDHIDHIKMISKDLRISLEKQQYLELGSLLEDLLVLKRYILITTRLVFEKLIKVIINKIEDSKCDLMLRANLNMISTLSNIDYNGFASLNDAFLKNQTIRVLLIVCIDSKLPSVRALALRALATICSTNVAIQQFNNDSGIDILGDILLCDNNNDKRTEPERREAVSLLTQITAPWHGNDNKVKGIKFCVDNLVEGLTDIVVKTSCCQTLLLCAASLNNLTRLEVTSLYSIMSNETIIKLKDAIEKRGPGVSIFLCEQVISMIYNMSGNKKCHSHLANKTIITFITSIFETQFYEEFLSRAECDAHRRTIKTILHIFSRLIHDSIIGQELLERNFIPIFTKVEKNLCENSEYIKDISFLTKQMNESLSHKQFNRSTDSRSSSSSNCQRPNYIRQESYV